MDASTATNSCVQRTPTSIAPPPLPPSRISFLDLPYEIRRQIWLLTFEPRILCLHINQHVTPARLDFEGMEIQESPRVISVSFDCKVPTASPSDEFDEYYNRRRHLVTLRSDGDILSGGRAMPGPVALHICHESRALALQRYKRAFGRAILDVPYKFFRETRYEMGDNSVWENAQMGTPKIWVDFERDIIVVDSTRKPRLRFPDRAPFGPLSLMRMFAKEESQHIRRLGIAARRLPRGGSGIVSVLRGRTFASLGNPPTQSIQQYKKEWLFGFENLKELILDDVPHRGNRSNVPVLRPPHLPPRPPIRPREEMLDSLRKAALAGSKWDTQPPEIQMVKDNDWNTFL
jgi:hypothetical protein